MLTGREGLIGNFKQKKSYKYSVGYVPTDALLTSTNQASKNVA